MGGTLATGTSIYMASAGVPAADGAGLSSIKSFSQLLTSIAAMPLAGGTFTGHVLFTDNTYDIGASGATRPRTVYAGTSVITPLLNNSNAAALTLGNATYGVTVPGGATITGGGVASTSGIIVGSYASGIGGIWPSAVTPSTTNYVVAADSTNAYLNIPASGGVMYISRGGGNLGNFSASGLAITTVAASVSMTTPNIITASYAVHKYSGVDVAWSLGTSNSGQTAYRNMINVNDVGTIVSASGAVYGWASSTTPAFNAANVTGIGQSSAGVVEINNGTLVSNGGSYGGLSCAGITASGVVSHGAYTVATLPAAGSNAGKMAQVTDSNVAASGNYGATVAAGGANRVKVFSDGTNWVIA